MSSTSTRPTSPLRDDVGLIAVALAAGGVCSAIEAMAMPYGEALQMNVRLAHHYEEERRAFEGAR